MNWTLHAAQAFVYIPAQGSTRLIQSACLKRNDGYISW